MNNITPIWEEKNLIGPKTKSENNGTNVPNDIIKNIKNKSKKIECKDIGMRSLINEKKTFELFGYNSNQLSKNSTKRVIRTCVECGKDKEITFRAYRDRCHKCQATQQAKEAAKISSIKRIGTHHKPETIEKIKKSVGKGINHRSYGTHPSDKTRKKLSECKTGSKNHFYGKHHTKETKEKISIKNSGKLSSHYGKPAFHGKHIDYLRKDGIIVKLSSSWEEKVANYLDTNNFDWEYEKLTLPIDYEYFGNKKSGTLTIDFFIKNKNEIWEVKGWWRDDAREKYEAAIIQYPQYSFKLLDKVELKRMKIL
jgi:hypothetical protein